MNKHIKRIEFLTFSVLLLFFVGISFGVVTLGAKVYKQIEVDANSHFEIRTPATYVMMKIRQNDRVDGVDISQIEGVPTLVLREGTGDSIYETWIYVYENALREVYIQKGDEFSLVDGDQVMPLQSMEVIQEEDRINISLTTLEGDVINTKVTLQADRRGRD